MASDSSETQALIRRVEGGDDRALAELFARYRGRLRRMIKLRLDRRLQGRFDPSDVLQEAYLDVAKRAREYLANPAMPVFLWLRWITGEKLLALHRRHLGAQMRDAGQEVSLHRRLAATGQLRSPWRQCSWAAHLADPRRGGPRCRSVSRMFSILWIPSTVRS